MKSLASVNDDIRFSLSESYTSYRKISSSMPAIVWLLKSMVHIIGLDGNRRPISYSSLWVGSRFTGKVDGGVSAIRDVADSTSVVSSTKYFFIQTDF